MRFALHAHTHTVGYIGGCDQEEGVVECPCEMDPLIRKPQTDQVETLIKDMLKPLAMRKQTDRSFLDFRSPPIREVQPPCSEDSEPLRHERDVGVIGTLKPLAQ